MSVNFSFHLKITNEIAILLTTYANFPKVKSTKKL